MPKITILNPAREISVPTGALLLDMLRDNDIPINALCGGKKTCGKCKVLVNGEEVYACRTFVNTDFVVRLPEEKGNRILLNGILNQPKADQEINGNLIAIDLGTTTVVCYLLDKNGEEMAVSSMLNPQGAYGADVVSRMQAALNGMQTKLCESIRDGLTELILEVCQKANVPAASIVRISLVGNPCMQQLLMDISTENLAKLPFAPALTEVQILPSSQILPVCPNADFLVIPDISGYVGADTLGCVLSSKMYQRDGFTLLIDIGTNGELVLGNASSMVACSTAAGPALEGANIHFGMRGSKGAIDHVEWRENQIETHVIGECRAKGICGSGLIDAAALLLKLGVINKRGRMGTAKQLPQFARYLKEVDGERVFSLTEDVYLTQADIRQVQLAKGAIAAGIELMAKQRRIALEEIREVLLAGAFGSFIRPSSACEIGMLPPEFLSKIRAIGNGAGSGAKLLSCSRSTWQLADRLSREITFLELASLPEFQRCFGANTFFP